MNDVSYECPFICNIKQIHTRQRHKIYSVKDTQSRVASKGDNMAHVCTKHPEVVTSVKTKMPNEEILIKMSAFLKVLADPTRLKIATALLNSELCVCDIASLIGMEHSAVSHQMSVLRKADVVHTRRDGKIVYYSLSDEHVEKLIVMTLEHVTE